MLQRINSCALRAYTHHISIFENVDDLITDDKALQPFKRASKSLGNVDRAGSCSRAIA